jgi:hypothetical protein
VYSPACSVPQPSHQISCTPTKSNLYLDSSLETVIREPALYKLHTIHNPNSMSIFHRLGRLSRESVQVRGSLMTFVRNQPPSWRTITCRFSASAYSICSQLPSLAEGRSSICNPRTRHAVVTPNPLNMVRRIENYKFCTLTFIRVVLEYGDQWRM